MNANDAHNRMLYIAARERHSIGRTNMSDAELVAEQEREIISYRNRIKAMEEECVGKNCINIFEAELPYINYNGERYKATSLTITESVSERRCISLGCVKVSE